MPQPTTLPRVSGAIGNTWEISVGKSEWKRPSGNTRCYWEDNKVDGYGLDLVGPGWNLFQDYCEGDNEPSGFIEDE
jgi:hypothetical protein